MITPLTHNNDNEKEEYDHTNVFVKFLPKEINDEGLKKLFSPFGVIISHNNTHYQTMEYKK